MYMSSFSLSQAQQQMVEETLSRITYTTNQTQGTAEADLIVEAIIENLEIKQKLFKDLDNSTPRYWPLTIEYTVCSHWYRPNATYCYDTIELC